VDGGTSISETILSTTASNDAVVDIGSIDRIQAGQNTLRFEMAR
jgi:hypothetical protein